jgi:hypothetical protein
MNRLYIIRNEVAVHPVFLCVGVIELKRSVHDI